MFVSKYDGGGAGVCVGVDGWVDACVRSRWTWASVCTAAGQAGAVGHRVAWGEGRPSRVWEAVVCIDDQQGTSMGGFSC